MKSLLSFVLILFSGFTLAGEADFYPFQNGTLKVPSIGNKEQLECVGCHFNPPPFVKAKFNQAGDFHGPNCYNTALISSGVMKPNQIRYVSPEEFEALLKTNFSAKSNLSSGDVIVFDAKSSRGHAAFSLGENLVFHKKSYGTYYTYRITSIENVGVVEKKEWTPNPFEGSIAQFNWPELGKLPKAFYKTTKKTISYDPRFARVLTSLEPVLVNDFGKWAVAKKWGLIGKNLIEDYLKLITPQADSLTKGMFISFKDQMQLYFDEVHFKNARNYDRVTEEVCLPEDKTQLQQVYQFLGKTLGRSDAELQKNWERVLSQDKKRCRERL